MTIQETDARPAMLTVAGATAYSGFSRSRLYVEMAAGKLDVRRAGRRTLITRESVDALLAALPRAVATNRPGARHSTRIATADAQAWLESWRARGPAPKQVPR